MIHAKSLINHFDRDLAEKESLRPEYELKEGGNTNEFEAFVKGAMWQFALDRERFNRVKALVEQIVTNAIYEIPGTNVAQQMMALEQIQDVFK